MAKTIEINGVQYVRNEVQPTAKKSGMASRTLMMIAAMEMACGGRSFKSPSLPPINIVKEYELILQKKSNLSKSQRDMVQRAFEREYTKIKTDPTK